MKSEIIEKELSYTLGGIFFKIQKELGRFCRERQYGDALEKKLKDRHILFEREVPLEVAERKSNFADFVIHGRIILDIKAKPFIEKDDYYQMQRYLQVSGIRLGLIVNFRDRFLKPKRVLNSQFVDSHTFVVLHRKGFTPTPNRKQHFSSRARIVENASMFLKNEKYKRREKLSIRCGGFTLAELLVYLGLFGILAFLAGNILAITLESKNTSSHLSEIQSNANRLLNFMVEKVHSSVRITDASTTLNLEMASSSVNPTVFSLSASGTIILQEGIATSSLSPDTLIITALSFTKITNPNPSTSSVQILMTIGCNTNGVADSAYSFRTTAMPL